MNLQNKTRKNVTPKIARNAKQENDSSINIKLEKKSLPMF